MVCNQTGADASSAPPGSFAANGVPVTSTATSSAVITDAGNASDKTTMSGSVTSTVTASGAGGQLTSVHLAAQASASLTTAVADTKCGAIVSASGGASFQFDLAGPTLVTITAEGHRLTGVAQVVNVSAPTGSGDPDGVVSYNAGSHPTSTASGVLRAGTGLVSISQVQAAFSAPATAGTLSTSGDFTLDITFQPAGAASTAASGPAGKYVSLGAARDCGAGTLPLTWTKKAGKGKHRVIKKAVVEVNGAKVATIKKPKKGDVSMITGLNAEKGAEVEVWFKIKGKGKGKLTAERSYLRCA